MADMTFAEVVRKANVEKFLSWSVEERAHYWAFAHESFQNYITETVAIRKDLQHQLAASEAARAALVVENRLLRELVLDAEWIIDEQVIGTKKYAAGRIPEEWLEEARALLARADGGGEVR